MAKKSFFQDAKTGKIVSNDYAKKHPNTTIKHTFKQLSKWSENIYNTAVVIDYFVANQSEIEECYNLAPVVKHLRNDADVLNAFFIDHEKEVEI